MKVAIPHQGLLLYHPSGVALFFQQCFSHRGMRTWFAFKNLQVEDTKHRRRLLTQDVTEAGNTAGVHDAENHECDGGCCCWPENFVRHCWQKCLIIMRRSITLGNNDTPYSNLMAKIQ
jgi:hypothetical protein